MGMMLRRAKSILRTNRFTGLYDKGHSGDCYHTGSELAIADRLDMLPTSRPKGLFRMLKAILVSLLAIIRHFWPIWVGYHQIPCILDKKNFKSAKPIFKGLMRQVLKQTAVYNLSSLTYEKCKDLTNREVVLFPDLSKDGKAYDLWQQKAEEFESKIDGSCFVFSDLLERNADNIDRENGLDLADYLVRFDWEKSRNRL